MDDRTDYEHAGPGTPMGMVLRKFWQPVALASDLLPGQATAIRVMNEDLTLYKGESGKPHIVAARCAHRSTLLQFGWVEEDCIRCRYHGWKYDSSGQCVEMPAEDPSFPPKLKILSYPAQEYAGLIFAFLGEGTPPELPRKAELDRNYGVKWTEQRVWPCNWFQRLENSVDAVHVSFVHRGSVFGTAVSSLVPTLEFEETDWGIRMIARRSAENVRISELLWPNCNHIVTPFVEGPYPWVDLFNWFVPIDDETSALFSSRCAPLSGDAARQFEESLRPHLQYNPAEEEAALFRKKTAPEDTRDPVAAQDYVTQVGQGRIVDRSQERLGKSDAGIIVLRRIYQREMEAAQKGLPGKQWKPRAVFARLPVPPGVPEAPDLEMAK
jgi:5,5'-dehydrodivanillate O-demethylase oxygenase subunit